MEKRRLDRIQRVVQNRLRDSIVVLEDIHDPHNAAAILRTCDAMGIQNVWFVFDKETPYNPKRIGKATSSSANKWLDFRIFHSPDECIAELKKSGYSVVVTALTDTALSLPDYDASEEKIAIVMGNEHSGASETMIQSADVILRIPMMGFVQSLNVSVATAIVLWEITGKRKKRNNWQLPPEEHKELLENLLEKGKH